MHKVLLTAAIVILPLLTAAPAYATNGADAERACKANPKCTLLPRDSAGGITMIIGDTIIDCNSEQAECIAVRTVRVNKNNFAAPTGGFAIR